MDWMTFIVELSKALAWPIAFITAVVILRNNFTQLFPRLKKLKHKDTEVEFFEEMLKELEAENQEQINIDSKPSDLLDSDHQYNFLKELSDASPRAAVLESYRILESALTKRLRLKYPELREKRNPANEKPIESQVLDPQQFEQLKELRALRNRAAHMDDFDLKRMPIHVYIDTAVSLAKQIESGMPN